MGRAVAPLLVLLLAAGGCGPVDAARAWTRTELYFGLTRADGRVIGDAEFDQFVAASVAPRFPAGFTVLGGRGYFGSGDQRPHEEPTRVLLLFHDDAAGDGRETDARVAAVAREYAERFEQESVLRTDSTVRARFVRGAGR